ncbi:MAG TPA: Maf family protein [Mobilitalea sp.]|nr:Maf family protein [Mobilitalea sp.]
MELLASESPRRKEIMNQMGISFESVPSHVNEDIKESDPTKMVEALASLKAGEVAGRFGDEQENLIIIGADTIVYHNGQVLGKPKDRDDAIRMLKGLSGDIHDVYTGVSIIIRRNKFDKANTNEDEKIVFNVRTRISVKPLSEEEIEDYVNSGEPFDKAGAYAIQSAFGIYIKEIHGDYYNVVGFPIAKIYEELLKKGINIKK